MSPDSYETASDFHKLLKLVLVSFNDMTKPLVNLLEP